MSSKTPHSPRGHSRHSGDSDHNSCSSAHHCRYDHSRHSGDSDYPALRHVYLAGVRASVRRGRPRHRNPTLPVRPFSAFGRQWLPGVKACLSCRRAGISQMERTAPLEPDIAGMTIRGIRATVTTRRQGMLILPACGHQPDGADRATGTRHCRYDHSRHSGDSDYPALRHVYLAGVRASARWSRPRHRNPTLNRFAMKCDKKMGPIRDTKCGSHMKQSTGLKARQLHVAARQKFSSQTDKLAAYFLRLLRRLDGIHKPFLLAHSLSFP